MKIRPLAVAGILCLVLCMTVAGHAAGPSDVHSAKKVGVLLVAFGTSVPEAQVSFDHIERAVKLRYAGTPVRWAFTSHIIRKKLAAQGRYLDSPATALAKMQDEKFTHVAAIP